MLMARRAWKDPAPLSPLFPSPHVGPVLGSLLRTSLPSGKIRTAAAGTMAGRWLRAPRLAGHSGFWCKGLSSKLIFFFFRFYFFPFSPQSPPVHSCIFLLWVLLVVACGTLPQHGLMSSAMFVPRIRTNETLGHLQQSTRT